MCQQHRERVAPAAPLSRGANEGTDAAEDFPWDCGVFDAHCHPTDTMASIASIPTMRAQALTIMATRSQDQQLVASVAEQHAIRSRADLILNDQARQTGVVPAFGWHPWFSHLLYDDSLPRSEASYDSSANDQDAQKANHYTSVLNPTPDPSFIRALPTPQPLSVFLIATRSNLQTYPLALVGEVGVDKAFRLPEAWTDLNSTRDSTITSGGREGRMLSPYHVRMPHQVRVLVAQLREAGALGRAASVHGVQAHGVLYEALAKMWKGREKRIVSRKEAKMTSKEEDEWSETSEGEDTSQREREFETMPFPPRICLHSFSGPPQILKQYLHPSVPIRFYFSFSMAINLSTVAGETKFFEALNACPDDQLLAESDLHTAGEDMDVHLEQIYRKICKVKGWTLEEGVQRLRSNYHEFIFGPSETA